MNTPTEWRHVRIIETDEDQFALRSFYAYTRFGPMALIALGIDHHTKTEGLSGPDALELGRKIEKAIMKMNNEKAPRKRSKE